MANPFALHTRRRTAEAMGMYFTVGSTLRLSNTVGQLLDILRSKDDAGKL